MKARTRNCTHPTCPPQGPCRRPPTPKKSRKRIRKVSLKQQKRLRQYTAQKRAVFTGDNTCAVALLENKSPDVVELFKGCQYFAIQQHHPAGREGERLFDKCIQVCGSCHEVLERKPALAKKLGLSKSRLNKNITCKDSNN